MLFHSHAQAVQRQTCHMHRLQLKATVSIFGFSISIMKCTLHSKRRLPLDTSDKNLIVCLSFKNHLFSRFVDIYTIGESYITRDDVLVGGSHYAGSESRL